MSPCMRCTSLALDCAKFDPPDEVASYPFPAAEGRGWKYRSDAKPCAINSEPMTWPFFDQASCGFVRKQSSCKPR